MNNSDMPAMPTREDMLDEDGKCIGGYTPLYFEYSGLTKREDFAIKLMAAARSNAFMFERADTDSKVLAKGAIQDADALLKELDK